MRTLVAALTLTLNLAAPAALADFTGDYTMKMTRDGAAQKEMKGKVMANTSAKKFRMDMEQGPMGAVSQIFDHGSHKGYMLIHKQRMAMTMNAADFEKQAPSAKCASMTDPGKCLADMGFKRTGTETVNGFSCNVYEREENSSRGGKTHTKFYHPASKPGAPLVRMVSEHKDGGSTSTTQMDVTNLKFVPVAASQFAIPKGYAMRDMSGVMPKGGAAGGKGGYDKEAMKRQIMEQMKAKKGR